MLSKRDLAILRDLNSRIFSKLSDNSQRTPFDLTRFSPIINHRLFQRLKYLKQLANVDSFFLSASHTRFEHSLDTAYWQEGRNRFWLQYGMISDQEAETLLVLALIHDISHGPFSHILDRVCTKHHDDRTAIVLKNLQQEIEDCGVSLSDLLALVEEKNPLYKAVKHHPLGTDKLSYLTLDSKNCGVGTPNLGQLADHIFWINSELVVSSEYIQELLELKRFYINMYKKVYLSVPVNIGRRIIEKEITWLLKNGLNENILWNMTDEELIEQIRKNERGRYVYMRYQYLKSKPVVAFELNNYNASASSKEREFRVFVRNKAYFLALITQSDCKTLTEKEAELAKLLKIDPLDIDIVPPMGMYRFIPKPITIVNGSSTYTDIDAYPQNHRALEELADNAMTIHVCVTDKFKTRVFKQGHLIADFFNDWVIQANKSR